MPLLAALFVAASLLTAGTVGQSPTPTPLTPSTSARVAALQFALANGISRPKGEVVVAVDSYFGAIDGHPAVLPMAEQQREAKEMAALLGPDVKVVSAASYLTCAAAGNNVCAARKNVSVVVVGGMYVGQFSSGVQLYVPGPNPSDPSAFASMTHAVVELRRGDKSWIGVRFSMGPSTLTRKK